MGPFLTNRQSLSTRFWTNRVLFASPHYPTPSGKILLSRNYQPFLSCENTVALHCINFESLQNLAGDESDALYYLQNLAYIELYCDHSKDCKFMQNNEREVEVQSYDTLTVWN